MKYVDGRALVLTKNLNFYGGLDVSSGEIIDPHHPERGANIAGCVLVVPGGEGSSSSPTALIECMRAGRAPSAIVTPGPDAVVAIADYISELIDGVRLRHAVVPGALELIRTGDRVRVGDDGRIVVTHPEDAHEA